MTYTQFMTAFPDNDACVEYLRQKFFPDGSACPKCGKDTKFHRIKSRAAYSCQFCGGQVYPTAGTIFHKSSTSLQLWFWAIFLMSSTRCGISAKQLEREIGVSYPTAHRMFKQIRSLLSDDDGDPLSGEVEMDETYVGGKPRVGDKMTRQERYERKVPVWAAVERGGQVRAKVLPHASIPLTRPKVRKFVLPASMVFTDESTLYDSLHRDGYHHKRIKHSAQVYVEGDVTTNAVEGFFGLFKNGVRGVYHAVSEKYLQGYVDEYAFRYNRRDGREPIFWAILDRAVQDRRLAVS
jgi:transposase